MNFNKGDAKSRSKLKPAAIASLQAWDMRVLAENLALFTARMFTRHRRHPINNGKIAGNETRTKHRIAQ